MSTAESKHSRSRKCRHCKQLFRPDHRNRAKQRYCDQSLCRQASKRASQQRWMAKEENRDYFCGEQNTARNRAWRQANPGYWRRSENRGSCNQDTNGRVSGGTQQEHCPSQPDEDQTGAEILAQGAQQDHSTMQLAHFVGLLSILTGEAQQEIIEQFSGRLHRRGTQILGSWRAGQPLPPPANTTDDAILLIPSLNAQERLQGNPGTGARAPTPDSSTV